MVQNLKPLFEEGQCAVILFSLSAKLIPKSSYILSKSKVKFAQTHCDPGFMVCKRLALSKHCNYISQKAYYSLYLIFELLIDSTAIVSLKNHLHFVLVRSQLVYCSQLWTPCPIKDIKSL